MKTNIKTIATNIIIVLVAIAVCVGVTYAAFDYNKSQWNYITNK